MKLTPIFIAMVMIVSVLCSFMLGAFFAALIATGFFITFAVRSVITRRIDTAFLAATAAAALSVASYAYTTSSEFHPMLNYIGRYIVSDGIIMSNPQESNTSGNYRYVVRINKTEFNNEIITKRDTIMLTTPDKFECGDCVTIKGIVKEFPSQMNENGFNTALYYQSLNVYTRIYSDEVERTGKTFAVSPYFVSQKLSGAIDDFIYQHYYGDSAAVLSSMLTGNMHHFSAELDKVIRRTAFKRLLHPAYIHIWIIVGLIGLLRRVVPKKYRNLAIIAVLSVYAVFSCSNIGFTRCIITAALLVFYRAKDGSVYFPDVIAKIVIFCILTMPVIIFNVTFVLSVSGGLIISLYGPYVSKKLLFLPPVLRHTATVAVISLLFLTPVATLFFNGVCIYVCLAMFITMPLVLALLVMTPAVFALLGLFGTAPVIGSLYELIIWIMKTLPYFIAGLPFSSILIPTPSSTTYCLIISILFMIYYYIHRLSNRLYVSSAISLGLVTSLALSAVFRIGTTDFVFVNVGQGDGAVIHTSYGATVIIDGGGGSAYSDYNIGENVFVPYLESKGYHNIDAAFVSHFHKDHVEGVIAAIEYLNVKNVFYMEPEEETEELYKWYTALSEAAAEHGTELHPITEDERIGFGCGLNIDVYVPDKVMLNDGDENDTSILIKASYAGTSALYTGDMTETAEREFMRCGVDVDADILKVAHHGSSTSTTPEWVEAVSPEYAIISCGEDNRFGHPTKQTLETLSDVSVMRTDIKGDITVTADKSGRKIYTFK